MSKQDTKKATFEEMREWARSSDVKTQKEWYAAYKRGYLPKGFHFNPYKLKGWTNWYDFLGKEQPAFVTLSEMQEWVKNSVIDSQHEWEVAYSRGDLPAAFVQNPQVREGWPGWPAFLGRARPAYVSSAEMRKWAKKSDIKTGGEWRAAYRRGDLPEGFVSHPNERKDWLNWDYFLGTKKVSFDEMREWARASSIKTQLEWRTASKRGDLPAGFVANPKGRDGWVDWYDFLGTEKKKFKPPLEEMREWARESSINTQIEWQAASKRGDLPEGFVANPSYRDGWVDWADFLGINKVNASLEEMAEWARKSGIKNKVEWEAAYKSDLLPKGFLCAPHQRNDWVDWYDFLGMEKRDTTASFDEMREWARASSIKTSSEWYAAYGRGDLPEGFVSIPRNRDGWVNWPDFLGTEYASFEEMRKWARKSNIKTKSEWDVAYGCGDLPDGFLRSPESLSSWISWYDFLGTEKASLEEMREWARKSDIKTKKEWQAASTNNLLPASFIRNPSTKNGWNGWEDFLDRKRKLKLARQTNAKPSIFKKVFNLFDIFTTGKFPYDSAGKREVTEMIMEQLGYHGHSDLNMMFMPGNGREVKYLLDDFNINAPESIGVEHSPSHAKALRKLFEVLHLNKFLDGVLPIHKGDVDRLVLDSSNLSEYNYFHLDYNGFLIPRHIQAVERILKENSDAVVVVTLNTNRRGQGICYEEGQFPFQTLSGSDVELLFWQPYRGLRNCLMETFAFRRRPVWVNGGLPFVTT